MTFETVARQAVTADQRIAKAAKFGAELLHMAEPYGVEAIAIGSLPSTLPAFPFCEQSPAPLKPRLVLDWLGDETHIFQATEVENETTHVVCDTGMGQDAAITRAGPGFAFAIGGVVSGHRMKGVMFFGSSICRDDSTGRVLALLAAYAYARMLMILQQRPRKSLSDRQLEVLSWAAEGKTDWEIATILGLSNHTVDKYMRQIKEALGAVNRTAAIVAAMRCGLIA